jgi:polyribonucleotide nucleotidyltransferase
MCRVEATGAETPEPQMVQALRFAHQHVQPLIEAQWSSLAATGSAEEAAHRRAVQFDPPPVVVSSIEGLRLAELQEEAYVVGLDAARLAFSSADPDKASRGLVEHEARAGIVSAVTQMFPDISASICDTAVSAVMARAFRENLLVSKDVTSVTPVLRPDGRGMEEVRPITAHHDVLPVVHGSSFFQRGDTHVLATITLGSREDARITECLQGRGELTHHFFLHYDFPPYCTGEIGNATAVNRRMVGHGNLAEKALRQVMPDVSDFPYTVRVSAECSSSSGSSSMASACAASLALMDAGVPIKAAVAGRVCGGGN